MVKELTIFTYGDSSSLKTWSNVPYFLTTTLELRNIKVNRINVKPSRYISGIWDKIFLRIIKLFLPDTTYTFDRTPFFRMYVKYRMKRAVKKFKNTDAFISISFSFHPKKYTEKKVIMFCDWTYEYYFKYFMKRKPDLLENQEIVNQHKLQRNADEIVSLFPDVAEYIKLNEKARNVYYLGNVVNSFPIQMDTRMIQKKFYNRKIVFVGSKKYMSGLEVLLDALAKNFPEVQLDVIGISREEVNRSVSKNVHFHGYLDKSLDSQNFEYYEIVNNATFFVNTTPRWSAFSASLDVMYHYTPVIVSKYRSFEETFGEELTQGQYCNNTIESLSALLQSMLAMNISEYEVMANSARKSVEPFSWDTYVDKLLSIM